MGEQEMRQLCFNLKKKKIDKLRWSLSLSSLSNEQVIVILTVTYREIICGPHA